MLTVCRTQGYTVVHYAVVQGAEPLLEALMSAAAPVDTPTRGQNLTALHIAVRQGRRRMACVLAAAGAALDVADADGATPLSLADPELAGMLHGALL